MINDVVLIDGKWFVIEAIEKGVIWASNKDGEEFEFPISVLKD